MEVSGFESSHVIMSKKQAFLSGMFLDLNVGVMFLENDGMFVKKKNITPEGVRM